jgi:Flp pilus assembly protein TadG
MRTRASRRGSAMLEFALVATPTVVLLLATTQLCLDMWNYHTLAYSTHEATRYIAVHGRGCVTGTTQCSITVGNIATRLQSDSVGMDPSSLSFTLTTDSGAVTTCNPLSNCSSNSTRWPPTSNLDNITGKRVVVSASHTSNRILMILPKAYLLGSQSAVTATSTGTIAF